ncbi:MAG: LysM peptidoglycan-binding domain-containing protein [Lachnospiraceae bacterium]|nr:LysM peptidoglycan-binding domain-containing protein [Lachnospiraceae bacterium]
MEIYVVQPQDTVDVIAERTGADVAAIINTNQLIYPYRLAVGQALLISGNVSGNVLGEMDDGAAWNMSGDVFGGITGAEENGRKREIVSNGYAYPFISSWVLDQTLPYLSELSVFSYGFTEAGALVPPAVDDTPMVQAARAAGTRATLTLTPLGPDGRFNNQLVSAVVNRPEVQTTLHRNLVRVMSEKGYDGLNIDFEYVLGTDRDAFTAFVDRTRRTFNALGYYVSVALAPKYSDEQRGLLYEGMDYAGLGQAANSVLLMTYEWGYTYGQPMAVAPIDQVRRVVEYALTRIPAEKISLGVPNYGYDWPLPYVRGTTRARTLGNVEAVQLAIFYGVPIQFDETAQSPYFRYWQYGVEHVVWFEDVRSYEAKFRLVEEYGLRGIGVWQIMQLFRAGWELLADRFAIRKM